MWDYIPHFGSHRPKFEFLILARMLLLLDVRRDGRRIYAGVDTFRGCPIEAIYAITPDQVIELRDMGIAPGEKPRKPVQ